MKELTEIAKATILLCSSVGLNNLPYNPLTSVQWHELGSKIVNSVYKTPDKLLGEPVEALVKNLMLPEEQAERVHGLLSRGYSLAFALQELEERGIGLVTKSDEAYPVRLRQVLEQRLVPPVLYYCGDLSLANRKGIAIVGSRNVDTAGIACTSELAKAAAQQQLAVFSGGARGVDSISRESALAAGGEVVEFVADSMLKKLGTKEYRQAIKARRLLVLSAVKPTASFNVGNAMNRNKYVYALSQRAFVIASEKKKGGTWAGATESLSKKYVPVSVWKHEAYSGNSELAKLGADYFTAVSDIAFEHLESASPKGCYEELNLFSIAEEPPIEEKVVPEIESTPVEAPIEKAVELEAEAIVPEQEKKLSIFEMVLPLLLESFKEERSVEEACQELNLEKSQLNKWMEQAEALGLVVKKLRPKRYVVKE